jgi:putative PIN family toxin of toxin-antitoxin system
VTRVVIDPGVLVSAFISPRKAAPALLVDALLDGHFEMLVSPTLIAELTDVLGREKFAAHAAGGRAAAFIAVLLDRAEMVKDAASASLKTADADDDYLIAVAQAHNADAVVSGDGHLLDVTSSDLPVLTPREMVERLGLVIAESDTPTE